MTNVNSVELGKKIKYLRTVNGLSQSALGKKVGVVQNIIARYENGTARPSLDVLVRLAIVFDTTTDYLVGLVDFE